MERIDPEANADDSNQLNATNDKNASATVNLNESIIKSDSIKTQINDNNRIGELINESDTESESRLFIQSETDTNERETDDDVPVEHSTKANGGAQSLLNKQKKSTTIDNDSEIDDGDFAGFSDSELNNDQSIILALKSVLNKNTTNQTNSISSPFRSPQSSVKKEIFSTNSDENPLDASMTDITSPSTTPSTPSAPITSITSITSTEKPHQITTDPRYRNPFKYGWKRELVFRAIPDANRKSDNRGEVYYHAPNGKKLRTKSEITVFLRKDQELDIGDFTFAKESIGMPPDQEIVRNAKVQSSSQRSRPPPIPEISPVLGKRIPKPKMPKGASPPPPASILNKSASNKSSSGLKRTIETEIIHAKAPPLKNSNKAKGDPCSIQCVLAMGIIPQLQCKKCSMMFHPECIGYDRAISSNYICEKCIQEKATNASVSATNQTTNDQKTKRKNSGIGTIKSIPVAVNNENRPNASNLTPIYNKRSSKDDVKVNSKTDATNDTSPPQSVAIVAGRKYIMVPKTNVMSITPTGVDAVNGYKNTSQATTATKPLLTGDDTNIPPTKKRRLSDNIQQMTSTSNSLFAIDFFDNVSRGYNILLHTFQYLKVQELLRASRVCRLWNNVATNSILWNTVRMKNSQVNDWSGLMNALKKHGTQHLDLRKVLLSPTVNWSEFLELIGDVNDLRSIDLCKCPADVIAALFETNQKLHVINALSMMGDRITLPTINKIASLTELRLKAIDTIKMENLSTLKFCTQLRHLSLTSMTGIDGSSFDALTHLTALESLELGECVDLSTTFAKNVLIKLKQLERLRLEKGQGKCCTFDILETVNRLPKLSHLELVNFDIKSGFDLRIAQCKNLHRLLLIPTYISQSATTNNMILSGISKLNNTLKAFTWVVTTELLRVTELYVDQCYADGQEKRPAEDKIPILKPVPLMSKDAQKSADENAVSDTPQVEILPLHLVEKMIKDALPNIHLQILKVPFPATWRQTMCGHQ